MVADRSLWLKKQFSQSDVQDFSYQGKHFLKQLLGQDGICESLWKGEGEWTVPVDRPEDVSRL